MSVESRDERHALIAREAYLKAEKRGFRDGDPLDDWLAAEAEIDARTEATARKLEREGFAEYKNWLKTQIETISVRLDDLQKRAGALRGRALRAREHELAAIKTQRDALEAKLEALRKKGRTKRDELKLQAEQLLDELKRSLDKVQGGREK